MSFSTLTTMECCGKPLSQEKDNVVAEDFPKLAGDEQVNEPTFYIVVKKLQPVPVDKAPPQGNPVVGPLQELALQETADGNLYEGQWCGAHMHGKGKLVKKDGSVYTGEFHGSKAHGQGKFVASDGSTYEGQFVNNCSSGFGKYINKAKSVTISGASGPCAEAVNGSFMSFGTYNERAVFKKQLDGDRWIRFIPAKSNWMISTTADKDENNGVGWAFCVEKDQLCPSQARRWVVWDGEEWQEQPDIRVSASTDGTSYEGQWQQDESSGVGILHWPDGSRYEGQFLHSAKHGEGICKDAEGNIFFQGIFKNDQMAEGTFFNPDGRKYIGKWKDSQMHGDGLLQWPDGAIYTGSFRQGMRSGDGTITWPDGRTYKGQWWKGKQEGQGIYTAANGKVTSGKWKAGQLLKK